MKYIDYKWWFVRRNDAGKITEVAVRFYEGEYKTVKDKDGNDAQRYVRDRKLTALDMPETIKGSSVLDANSKHAQRYTITDFGDISTDDELRDFCNLELFKNKNGITIPEQTIA